MTLNSLRSGKNRSFLILGVVLCLAGGIQFSREQIRQQSPEPVRELIAPPKDIQYFTVGHREIIADLLWIRSIQDFDYCEKKMSEQLCMGQSWLYQMLDVITDLSPYFRMAYSAGSMALTVIISDIAGASKIFDKAVSYFPSDWIILYKAAYHAIYEEKDQTKAASLLEKAAKNGAPYWVNALAGRMYSEAGQIELAERLAADLQASGGDERVIRAIRERIQERRFK